MSRFVQTMGERALKIIRKLEANETRTISGYSFKALESVTMDEDYEKIINMTELEKKLNVGGFQNIVKKVVRQRWWIWVLQHPGLQPDRVHPSRGVASLLPPFSACMFSNISRVCDRVVHSSSVSTFSSLTFLFSWCPSQTRVTKLMRWRSS